MVQVEVISPKILVSSILSFSKRYNAGSLGDTRKPEFFASSGLLGPPTSHENQRVQAGMQVSQCP